MFRKIIILLTVAMMPLVGCTSTGTLNKEAASIGDATEYPALEIMRPDDGQETTRDVVHLLGRTDPRSTVTVNGEPVTVYGTGGFARDGISLDEGENVITVTAISPAGETLTQSVTVIRTAEDEAAEPAPDDEIRLLAPEENLALRPGDPLYIEVAGPSGLEGHVVVTPEVLTPLTEQTEDGGGTGIYRASIYAPETSSADPFPIQIIMDVEGQQQEIQSEVNLTIWDSGKVLVGETTEDGTPISYGLHGVRLGGPYLAEVPAGTRFEVLSQEKGNYEIRLADNLTAWTAVRNTRLLPSGTPLPHHFFTYFTVSGDEDVDILSIPYGEKVVFAVNTVTHPSNEILLDLYNTHHATTWGSHKNTAQIIGPVEAVQLAGDQVRLRIPVRSKQIWGFWTEVDGDTLKLYVKRPPEWGHKKWQPLSGLTIALEAGHGGDNSGARGLLGTLEKDVNRLAADKLEAELESRGATVVQMRPDDTYPRFSQRLQTAYDAGADLIISLHSNSAGTSGGYLRNLGTSTYYKHEHMEPLANALFQEMLGLGWGDFGVIANFNYSPLRQTRIPTVLVEQGFMSDVYEEARLIDPRYQEQQAEALADGLESFLEEVKE